METKATANAKNTEETNQVKVTVARGGENEKENYSPHSLCCLSTWHHRWHLKIWW